MLESRSCYENETVELAEPIEITEEMCHDIVSSCIRNAKVADYIAERTYEFLDTFYWNAERMAVIADEEMPWYIVSMLSRTYKKSMQYMLDEYHEVMGDIL